MVTAFYKGESQEKKHPRRLEGAKLFAVLSSPSCVESLWGFLSLQIHLAIVTHRDHRWDFPSCVWSPLPTCRRQYPGRFDGILFARTIPATSAFPRTGTGRLLHYAFRALLSVHSRYGLHARQIAFATLCTRGFSSLVASTAALIATGWSEPVPGRVYPRCGPPPFHGAPGNGVNKDWGHNLFIFLSSCQRKVEMSG